MRRMKSTHRAPFTTWVILATAVLFGFRQAGDPPAAHLIQPADLAGSLAASTPDRPPILQIGVQSLYKGAHITSAIYAGPASTPEGLANLERAVKNLPRDRAIVIYCGCCPWDKCPNVRPAYRRLTELGFTKVQVLKLPTNLHTDWVERGYPVDKSE